MSDHGANNIITHNLNIKNGLQERRQKLLAITQILNLFVAVRRETFEELKKLMRVDSFGFKSLLTLSQKPL